MFVVYVIRSAKHHQYTGHTADIAKRLHEHNQGKCKTTRTCTHWLLAYAENVPTRADAMKRERWLKTGAGRQFLNEQLAGWSPPQAE